VSDTDKHSSFLNYGINNDRKMFYSTGPNVFTTNLDNVFLKLKVNRSDSSYK